MKILLEEVRSYLPNLRKPLSSEKGSPTLEYVGILAAGALFAALLVTVFAEDEGGNIITNLRERVVNAITGGGGEGGNDE
ncbi:hypothetical protein CEN49_21735 [Fischerella thermalis CCMEE 5273]|nr:hypothetical protein CEN49_21735 [Fischerella thermalis CCMEE 5273]